MTISAGWLTKKLHIVLTSPPGIGFYASLLPQVLIMKFFGKKYRTIQEMSIGHTDERYGDPQFAGEVFKRLPFVIGSFSQNIVILLSVIAFLPSLFFDQESLEAMPLLFYFVFPCMCVLVFMQITLSLSMVHRPFFAFLVRLTAVDFSK